MRKVSFIMCVIMTVSFLGVLPINADSLKNEEGAEVFYEDSIVSDTFVDEDLIGQIPQIAITLSSGANGESQVTSEKFTNKKTVIVTPTGQPSDGYQGCATGSEQDRVFFFKTGGSSVKFTVEIDYKNVKFTAETGKSTSSGSGISSAIPYGSKKTFKFQFIKYYTISSKKIDVYKYGEYQYSYYVHSPSYSLGRRWVQVGTIG